MVVKNNLEMHGIVEVEAVFPSLGTSAAIRCFLNTMGLALWPLLVVAEPVVEVAVSLPVALHWVASPFSG